MNRALVRLLSAKEKELRDRGIAFRIAGIASRRLGWIADPEGIRAEDALALGNQESSGETSNLRNVREWLLGARADILFEATSLNKETGEPAIDHLKAALELGAHAITANKGPVIHAYDELRQFAADKGKSFFFESAVMDGVPIFSLFRETLPLIHLRGFRGVLNSTTNVILSGIESGLSFEAGLARAQALGVAETDASDDIDGWDAAVKVAALVRVLMREKLPLSSIARAGIRNLSVDSVRKARADGRPFKLVCRAWRTEAGIQTSVRPEQLPITDPLALVEGTSSAVYFETDIFPGLAIVEDNPGVDATAYGMLADFIRAVGK